MNSFKGGFSVPFMGRFLLHPDGDGGTGTKTEDDKPPKQKTAEEVVKQQGSESAALLWALSKNADLERDNHKQRGEIRNLTERLPKDGTRVLNAEDASAFDAYRAIGKPSEISAKIRERDEFEKKVTASNRDKEVRDIAKALKWDGDVLTSIVRDEQFVEIEEKDAKGNTIAGEDGKPKKTWAVKGANEGDAPVPVMERYAKLIPSLQPEQKNGDKQETPSREFRRFDSSSESGKEPKLGSLVR